MPKKKYYAVAIGRQMGVFDAWRDCEVQVKGFHGAKFKSFDSKSEAGLFVETNKAGAKNNDVTKPPLKTPEIIRGNEEFRSRDLYIGRSI